MFASVYGFIVECEISFSSLFDKVVLAQGNARYWYYLATDYLHTAVDFYAYLFEVSELCRVLHLVHQLANFPLLGTSV